MEKVRKIIMTICLIAFFCSALYLFNDYVISPIRTTNQLNELQELIGEGDQVLDQESLAEKYPDVVFPEGMLAKYADLYVRNPDIAGWINIEALDISLPVVRAENNEKYLDIAHSLWNYIKTKIIDTREGGEWHSQLTDEDIPADFKPVVDPWKCPYHNGRMCLEIISRT